MGKSSWPIGPPDDWQKQFRERLSSLTRHDEVRIMQLFETLQFTFLQAVLGFFLGASLDSLFPRFEEKKDIATVVKETLLQTFAIVILVFYLRKIVKLVPFLFEIKWDINGDGKVPKQHPQASSEQSGEITIAVVLVASQVNLLRKVDLLSRQFQASWFTNAEREASKL